MKIKENDTNTIILSVIAAVLTWFINHNMGYGAIVANGLVGVVGAIFLPGSLAGAVFTSSFVGMSGAGVIPSLAWATAGGLVAGLVIVFTKPIYAGLGGKGGTTAATSVWITRAIISLFN